MRTTMCINSGGYPRPTARVSSGTAAGLFRGALALLIAVALLGCESRSTVDRGSSDLTTTGSTAIDRAPRMDTSGKLSIWWDRVPDEVLARTQPTTGSNIHRSDYAGPDACRKCHPQNHAAWSEHPHRWMNALADESTVLGDFSGAEIDYLGGTGAFVRSGEDYRMLLERGGQRREYQVTQTIGRRFFQYYVGKMLSGPEPSHSRLYRDDHVLPFGYWLAEQQWVPVVHIDDELPEGERLDPFRTDSIAANFRPYAEQCNFCHTTFPLGDMLVRATHNIGRHAPHEFHLWTPKYLQTAHPELWDGRVSPSDVDTREMLGILQGMIALPAPEHAVTLGVSCEACHLGARAHAEGRMKKPAFVPGAPELRIAGTVDGGRTRENVNWACGRCHTGHRPQFAAGMTTWNSTEFDDLMRGGCTSQITCLHCHDPHQATGPKWSRAPEADDAVCLSCHSRYSEETARHAHTHHSPGGAGDRCLNCHMPRLNEGLQDLVRTHMIFSPTNREMVEAGQPNACNLCHTDQPIDWTLTHLKSWYGVSIDESAVTAAYPQRDRPAALNWLKHQHESVRLVAADALCRTDARFAVPELVGALDDAYLINRQFAQRGIERMLDCDLEEFGYRFYMQRGERRLPLDRVRQWWTTEGSDAPRSSQDESR